MLAAPTAIFNQSCYRYSSDFVNGRSQMAATIEGLFIEASRMSPATSRCRWPVSASVVGEMFSVVELSVGKSKCFAADFIGCDRRCLRDDISQGIFFAPFSETAL